MGECLLLSITWESPGDLHLYNTETSTFKSQKRQVNIIRRYAGLVMTFLAWLKAFFTVWKKLVPLTFLETLMSKLGVKLEHSNVVKSVDGNLNITNGI